MNQQEIKWHGHEYVCTTIKQNNKVEVITSEKLPPILRKLRKDTNYTFKVPHGNKVRTLILEEGICIINDGNTKYEITIKRW